VSSLSVKRAVQPFNNNTVTARQRGVSFGSTFAERNAAAEKDAFQMPDARLTAPIQVMLQSYHYRERIVWDTPGQEFILRADASMGLMAMNFSNYSLQNSKETPIPQGTVLNKQFIEGAVVDQVNQKIILPDGRAIDGPTGNVLNVHGDVRVYGSKEEALKAKKENTQKSC
jgi:hypothetical protein